MLLSCALIFSFGISEANAVEAPAHTSEAISIVPFASGRFSTSVKANTFSTTSGTLALSKGDYVKVEATYLPAKATVDFGIVDSDWNFYYISSSTGSVSGKIKVPENGNYTFAIRNNSSSAIDVSGIITY